MQNLGSWPGELSKICVCVCVCVCVCLCLCLCEGVGNTGRGGSLHFRQSLFQEQALGQGSLPGSEFISLYVKWEQ